MSSKRVNDLVTKTSITLLSWLFPITYLLHIAEEYFGGEGYSAYLLRLRGIQLSPTRFLVVQAFGLALMMLGIIMAHRLQFPSLLNVILGAVVLVNGLVHTTLSLIYAEYIPGLITSVLFWIPLGIATLIRLKRTMTTVRFLLGVVVGAGINGIIELVTSSGG